MSYSQFLQPRSHKLLVWNRTLHRWIALVFTATVAMNFMFMALGEPPKWVVYAPLPFLFAMLATGLLMLVTHYRARLTRRS